MTYDLMRIVLAKPPGHIIESIGELGNRECIVDGEPCNVYHAVTQSPEKDRKIKIMGSWRTLVDINQESR